MYTVRYPSSSSTFGSVTPVLMVTSTCSLGLPSCQNAGCLVLKSRTWLAVTFSMMPLIRSPGRSNFAPLLDWLSIWSSIWLALILDCCGCGMGCPYCCIGCGWP